MESLTAQIKPTFESLADAISGFAPRDFNSIPFSGSWTAGQVAEHVKLSVQGIPELFTGAGRTSDRKPDEKVQMVADVFLDFETKYESPEFIVPEQKEYERDIFVRFFTDYAKNVERLAATLDMSLICVGFEIPGFGPMTRLEFLSFALFHTQRHVRQILNIRKVLSENAQA